MKIKLVAALFHTRFQGSPQKNFCKKSEDRLHLFSTKVRLICFKLPKNTLILKAVTQISDITLIKTLR